MYALYVIQTENHINMKCRESQKKTLLDFLKRGKHITPLKALYDLGIYRLAARIRDLKDDGHKIKSEMVYEHPVKFARYKLISK
jgi:hypothetical protein